MLRKWSGSYFQSLFEKKQILDLTWLSQLAAGRSDVEILQPKDVFGITAMMTCVFNVVKAGLYACQDFQFMAQASLWVAWRDFRIKTSESGTHKWKDIIHHSRNGWK